MGKASRWIRNLLVGKKDDKISTKDESTLSTSAIIPASPKRRWSFRKSNNTEKVQINHKSCRSFDSIATSQLVSQALFDYAILQQSHNSMMVVPPLKATTRTLNRVSIVTRVAAATKIQSAFRSYLARKALCALRGLVKLQALVRGHLVRKRTTTMVRCMSALVSIQVRARFQRIQLAEDAESRSHHGATKQGLVIAHERRLSSPQLDHKDNLGKYGSKMNTNTSYRQSSRRFSIDLSREKSMRMQNKPMDEVSTASQTSTQHDEPNYMTRTESSRAKARSHSEPRQRPTKQKRENRTSSNEGLCAVTKGIQTHDNHKYHEDWLAKLHRSSKSINDFEFDSSYYTTLYAYETAESAY
ncbi:uncharacterized protein [Rutidosis leptorrhynchoides]|uniref:uncharacterized protein n=1 Tax=Rutidosis leptorrhynchoides TaxID=125765 RepID=UPI003A990F27